MSIYLVFSLKSYAEDLDKGIQALINKNYEEALYYLSFYAVQGDDRAQYNLGVMYDNGKGVLKDSAEAVKWYRKAAGQRHVNAQFNLGLIYGNSVLKDPVLAHMWWNIAASNGFEAAKKGRDAAEKLMTSEQLAEAQKLARECIKKNYKDCG